MRLCFRSGSKLRILSEACAAQEDGEGADEEAGGMSDEEAGDETNRTAEKAAEV